MTDPRDTALASLICERNDHPDAPACGGCYAMAAWLREHGYAAQPQPDAAGLRDALAKADEFLTRGSAFNGHTGPDPIAAHIVIEEALGRG